MKQSFFIIKLKYYIKACLIYIFIATIFSCNSGGNQVIKKYGGYQLTDHEYESIRKKAIEQQSGLYDSDSLWSIYDQVNDTLRETISDSIEFEIFLNTLDQNHFSIIVFSPPNQEYFESIANKFMTAKFQGDIPENRILCLYSYTNLDGSGDSPLEFAIKNKSGRLKL